MQQLFKMKAVNYHGITENDVETLNMLALKNNVKRQYIIQIICLLVSIMLQSAFIFVYSIAIRINFFRSIDFATILFFLLPLIIIQVILIVPLYNSMFYILKYLRANSIVKNGNEGCKQFEEIVNELVEEIKLIDAERMQNIAKQTDEFQDAYYIEDVISFPVNMYAKLKFKKNRITVLALVPLRKCLEIIRIEDVDNITIKEIIIERDEIHATITHKKNKSKVKNYDIIIKVKIGGKAYLKLYEYYSPKFIYK